MQQSLSEREAHGRVKRERLSLRSRSTDTHRGVAKFLRLGNERAGGARRKARVRVGGGCERTQGEVNTNQDQRFGLSFAACVQQSVKQFHVVRPDGRVGALRADESQRPYAWRASERASE